MNLMFFPQSPPPCKIPVSFPLTIHFKSALLLIILILYFVKLQAKSLDFVLPLSQEQEEQDEEEEQPLTKIYQKGVN